MVIVKAILESKSQFFYFSHVCDFPVRERPFHLPSPPFPHNPV